jgi:hypothetical protein
MAKLLFSLDGNLLGEYPLDKPLLRIGRRRDNDIAIDNLMISSAHAQILAIGQNALLQDLDSTNGTLVNGVRVKQHVLQHEDIITVGHYQLRYCDETGQPQRHALSDEAMTASAEEARGLTDQGLAVNPEASSGRYSGHLYVISGPDFGQDIRLTQSVTDLGAAELPMALILQNGADYWIQPLQDDGSLTVNGLPVVSKTADGQRLQDHDLIAWNGVKMEFYLAADDSSM